MMRNKLFLVLSVALLIGSTTLHGDWRTFPGQAPLASKQNALIYGATMLLIYKLYYGLFTLTEAEAYTMAATDTALNFASLSFAPHAVGQLFIPAYRALYTPPLEKGDCTVSIVGLPWEIEIFVVSCIPPLIGLGMLKLFGTEC